MKKFKILTMTALLGCMFSVGYAADRSVSDVIKKINADMRETRKKEGFNPDGGVTIVPLSQIHAPNNVKSQWMKTQSEQKKLGYYSTYSDRAKELNQLADTVQFKYEASLKNSDKKISIFRKTSSEITMGYDFIPIPEQFITSVYGFAAGNTFKDGWTGIVEFFKTEQLGNCAFTENNVTLTQQAAKVDQSIVRYDINDKVTVVSVEGNKESGYLYKVEWFDNKFFRTLECATLNYSVDTTTSAIALASKIDTK